MSQPAARYLWIQMAQHGYRKREPQELDLIPERPQLLNEIMTFYQNDLGYSLDDLARALKANPVDLMGMYGITLMKPDDQTVPARDMNVPPAL